MIKRTQNKSSDRRSAPDASSEKQKSGSGKNTSTDRNSTPYKSSSPAKRSSQFRFDPGSAPGKRSSTPKSENRSDTFRADKRSPSGTNWPNSKESVTLPHAGSDDEMRLNKYVALAGIASRRAADDLIRNGKVWVNGNEILEPGYRIKEKDRVTYQGKIIRPDRNMIYLLMNKPKDTITTTNDEKGRKTVLDIVQMKIKERVYPVGRLDRMTTGLLLLTNDGDLAKVLSHPSSEVRKIYHVFLDKNLSMSDFDKISKGLILEDGPTQIDGLSYIDGSAASEVGITLHSGKNRIVRRIFESLGYVVVKLDRVAYAGLTKKDVPRGSFRHLTEKEVTLLKHFGIRKKKR